MEKFESQPAATAESSVELEPKPLVHPVVQFVMLIVPVVMSGFFLVYSLTGLILEGRHKLNWSLEAIDVAVMVGGGIVVYSICVMAYAKFKRVGHFHILMVSSLGHLILSLILIAVVYIIVRL